jgi:hypothetical protein
VDEVETGNVISKRYEGVKVCAGCTYIPDVVGNRLTMEDLS